MCQFDGLLGSMSVLWIYVIFVWKIGPLAKFEPKAIRRRGPVGGADQAIYN